MRARFKTKSEFIKEFGKNWRYEDRQKNVHNLNFIEEMDMFLGQELNEIEIEMLIKNGSIEKRITQFKNCVLIDPYMVKIISRLEEHKSKLMSKPKSK